MIDRKIMRTKLYLKYLVSFKNNYFSNIDKKNKKIVVTLAADYGNLGDVAITYAQTKFLKKYFTSAEIIDFPISKTFSHMKALKSIVNDNDIITIVGGGNSGDMYDDIEYCRQFVINQFPMNKIVCFPQTIDYSDTKTGLKSLERSEKIYSKHKKLSISVREERSFRKYSQLFAKNRFILAPDIVLSLDESQIDANRKGITFVLRSDSEKKMNIVTQQKLIDMVSSIYSVRFNDTHISKNKMSIEERKNELDKIWEVFRRSELVITDRLHGMIFCAITRTPCIAIDNSNNKVSGVYNSWLKKMTTIRVIENLNVDEILQLIEELLTTEIVNSSYFDVEEEFDDLLGLLKDGDDERIK
jgi:pyruvyl transferase EpsI